MSASPRLPYFDRMLSQMRAGDTTALAAFERHVHYGYWADPAQADGSLADYVRAAEDMTALMLRAASLERGIARAHCCPQPGSTRSFVGGDATALPFEDGSFDAVLAVECAFHFASRARFLADAARVLRPGGHLTVSDFVLTAPMAACWRFAAGAIDFALAPMLGHYDMSYTLSSYRRAAEQAGLCLAETRDITAGMLPSIPMWRRFMRHLMPEYPGLPALFAVFAGLHRAGLVRYMVLSFERPQAPRVRSFFEPPAHGEVQAGSTR